MFSCISSKAFAGLPNGDYSLGAQNRIAGHNGSGKSSLFRAALWALTGLGPDGSDASTRYGDACVTVTLRDGTIIMRRRAGNRLGIAVNGAPVQTDANLLGSITPRAFACMLFPMAFFALDEKQRRELFLALTPDIDRDVVMSELCTGYKKGSLDWSMGTKKLFEFFNERRREYGNEAANLTGQITAYEAMAPQETEEPTESVEQLEELLVAAENDTRRARDSNDALREELWAWDKYNAELIVWERQKVQLNAWTNGRTFLEAPKEDPTSIREELRAMQEKLAHDSAQLKIIGDKGVAIAGKQAEAEKSLACPHCKRPYDNAAQIEEQRKALIAERASLTVEYKKLQKSVNCQQDALEKWQVKLAKAESAFAAYTQAPEVPPMPVAPTVNKGDLQAGAKIAADTLAKAMARMDDLTQRIASAKKRASAPLKPKIDLAQIRARLAKAQEQHDEAKRLEEALHPIRGIDAIILQRKLAKIKLDGYEFAFFEELKNGSVKDCFSIKRSSDGLSIESFSTGEKVKFGLALSLLIADLSGTPHRTVFIETADVVDRIIMPPNFQLSVERVAKDQPLTVEIKKMF
jgi:DNA repair exonuclease SbcCD ATPase subunit